MRSAKHDERIASVQKSFNVSDRFNIFICAKMRSAKLEKRIVSDREGFKWNSQILILKLYHDRFWAVEHLHLCVKMQGAKHDERIASVRKSF